MLRYINLFCVNMYIAKRHYEETKKGELILVKTWLFSILWKSLYFRTPFQDLLGKGVAYSNDDLIHEGGLTNDYGWLRGKEGVQNGKRSDDIICEWSLKDWSCCISQAGPYPEIFWGHRFLKWQFFLTDMVIAWG